MGNGKDKKLPIGDRVFQLVVLLSSLAIMIVMAGLLVELVSLSWDSILRFGIKFPFSTDWNPVTQEFGAAGSIFGTLVSTAIAIIIAVPMSIAIAIFLTEISHPLLAKPVGTAIELLAAIPSIIYGMWGLFVFAPFMADHVQPLLGEYLGFLPLFTGPPVGIGMLSAGIILALMILPFISSVMRDIFMMTPAVLRESAFGLGSTTWEVSKNVTIPHGLHGLIGACFLGLGRALGETMAVTFVIGNSHRISESLFAPSSSIASTLANEFNEASDPLYLSALVELGLILFIITFSIQVLAKVMLSRFATNAEGM